ncbi:hypothetical protein IP81_16215 [Novosphingobium sp. AAP83]|nr:hypothetical protein IP81_16215 [Novosphingobium sp. AAP83]
MLTGQQYEELKSKFSFRGEVTGRSAKPLLELLSANGVTVDLKSTKISETTPLQNLEHDALVYAKVYFKDGKKNRFRIVEKPPGHWMIWDSEEKVLRDPAGFDGEMLVEIRSYRKVLTRP